MIGSVKSCKHSVADMEREQRLAIFLQPDAKKVVSNILLTRVSKRLTTLLQFFTMGHCIHEISFLKPENRKTSSRMTYR